MNIGGNVNYAEAAAWLSFLCFVVAGLGCFYALGAAWLSRRLATPAPGLDETLPAVTILKPLHGAEPGLHANLASFCLQEYPGQVHIVFGVEDAADPAVAVVCRLIEEFPAVDMELVVDSRRHGANRKVSNLVNMAGRIKHEIVLLSDSDIRVERDYLRKVMSPLTDPEVGIVTCPYWGDSTQSHWAHLAALTINHHFLPGVLFGLELGLARPCFGSTMGFHRSTLARIGGFEAFVEQLADDYAMGEAVRNAGLRVLTSPHLVTHFCTERSGAELIRHELRWARTIRLLDPVGFVGSGITHALPFALLGALLGGLTPAGFVMVVSALACRLILQMHIDEALGVRDNRFWWGPVRDLLSFAIFVASFFGNAVTWRGRRYSVRQDGTLVYANKIGS